MNSVDLISQRAMVETIAKIEGVRDSVRGEAGEIFWKAQANLARHRQSGNARIDISEASLVSVTGKAYENWGVTVSMIDERTANGGGPGALAIEFGHFLVGSDPPRWVPGLNIMRGAAGL